MHGLSIHPGTIYNFVPRAEIKLRIERPTAIRELQSPSTGNLRQRRTQVNDIQLIDVPIMVDVFVNGISSLELIQFSIRYLVIPEYHRNGEPGLIANHITVLVTSHRSIRSTHTRHLNLRIIGILVYALITETIYGTERVVKLDTGQV